MPCGAALGVRARSRFRTQRPQRQECSRLCCSRSSPTPAWKSQMQRCCSSESCRSKPPYRASTVEKSRRPFELPSSCQTVPDSYYNRRIKTKPKGLPPALHRQQALSVAEPMLHFDICHAFLGHFKEAPALLPPPSNLQKSLRRKKKSLSVLGAKSELRFSTLVPPRAAPAGGAKWSTAAAGPRTARGIPSSHAALHPAAPRPKPTEKPA